MKYVGFWTTRGNLNGHSGGSFVPKPFTKARDLIVRDVARNLDAWARTGEAGTEDPQYAVALASLREATGPESYVLTWHVFGIRKAAEYEG